MYEERISHNNDLGEREHHAQNMMNNYNKQSYYNATSSSNDFVCITCHRGPPYTKKYAKN